MITKQLPASGQLSSHQAAPIATTSTLIGLSLIEAVRLPGLPACACRRALDSPDFQLLIRWYEDCDCGSKEKRARCCHRTLEAEDGGVIWPFLHQCDCGDQYDPYSNPKVGRLPSCTTSWPGSTDVQLTLHCPVAAQHGAVSTLVSFGVLLPSELLFLQRQV